MTEYNYNFRRLIHFIITILLSLFVISVFQIVWWGILIVLVLGFVFGYLIGNLDWKKVEKRIEKRNAVIIYNTDGAIYIILVFLFLLQYASRSLHTAFEIIENNQQIVQIIVLFVLFITVGYNYIFYMKVKYFETKNGKLYVKRFWSRSVSGQEGMIGKEGIVINNLNPDGIVEIDAEIWNAESIDKKLIDKNSKIIVKDIEGLKLIVDILV
jgi:membrane protein implicated in regulation of membrane protease activity